MSFEASAWAIKQKPRSAHEKLILIILADCYNQATTRCDPSIDYISELGICHRITAIRAIESLAEQGFILPKKAKGKRTHYELPIGENAPKEVAQSYPLHRATRCTELPHPLHRVTRTSK